MRNYTSKRFSKKVERFACDVCSTKVIGTGYTDHCPNCLWGKHVDLNPGDRSSECKGLMRSIKTEHNRNGFVILYKCEKCSIGKRVKAAKDDNNGILFKLLNESGLR